MEGRYEGVSGEGCLGVRHFLGGGDEVSWLNVGEQEVGVWLLYRPMILLAIGYVGVSRRVCESKGKCYVCYASLFPQQ
jgi:hypothetical protein